MNKVRAYITATKETNASSKSTIETQENSVKYVQS